MDTAQHPLRLGLFDIMQIDPLRQSDVPTMLSERLDDLERIDRLGYDAAFVAERHFLTQFAAASATAWLGAASQRTSRLRLGALAYTLPIKAPVELVEDIVMLDALTKGRLEVGFGMGHRVEELIALGVDPNQRIPLFQERLAVTKALLTGGAITYERNGLDLRGVAVSPVPVQDPFPPLWFAGTDPLASQWMAANGLGLAVGFKPTSVLAPTVAAYLAGLDSRTVEAIAAEPERPLGRMALMRSVIVGESDQRVRDEVTDDLLRLGELVDGEQSAATRGERRDGVSERFAEMIRDEVMIAGSVDTVASAIRGSRAEIPFDLFLASPYAMGASRERIATTLDLLGGPVREQLA
ncbi:MAG TPA: LLM class flavin-dependent oxidoreductase [Thermomicrobiales bacterium]|nr:LLM class flavin-dependent oxidoreductase [Thermomicrobiales bacterium]